MKKLILPAISGILISGCASTAATQNSGGVNPANIPLNTPPPISTQGLEAVMGQNAAALVSLFGRPSVDVREAAGRKLQFTGKPCILDAYLYEQKNGGGERVTHVDARRSDGAEVDRASCVNALRRR